MRADFKAVLDACVLLPMPLADTLLRMAERPRLYLPMWSNHIMEEVTRNLIVKWAKSPEKAAYREGKLREVFPEALVEGYEPLIEVMQNDLKDRHVLAAAVRSKSELIVTYNKKDFPRSALEPWGVESRGPSKFLRSLYDLEPALATNRLHEQAEAIRISYEDLLVRLKGSVPGFIDYVCEEQSIELPLVKLVQL
jgi:predicted nucleic acid-binding protein